MDNNNKDNKDNNVIKVDKLFYYPVKGQREIPCKDAQITNKGFLSDRLFAIIKTKKLHHVKISTHPIIEKITSKIEGNKCFVNIPGDNLEQNDFVIDLDQNQFDKVYEFKIYGLPCKGGVVSEALNKAVCTYFGVDCVFLKCSGDKYIKHFHDTNQLQNWKEDDRTSFADMAPVLITSGESLDYINDLLVKRNEKPVYMGNFRPNIVLSGGGIFWESKPKQFKINNVVFRRIKGCDRCKTTTWDRDANSFRETDQPLKILTEVNYSKELEAPIFGHNYCVDMPNGVDISTIKVGDILESIEY